MHVCTEDGGRVRRVAEVQERQRGLRGEGGVHHLAGLVQMGGEILADGNKGGLL